MSQGSVPTLMVRAFGSTVRMWKALLLALALNAALAFVLVRPAATALHETLDRNPWSERLTKGADPLFFSHFTRVRPDVLGDVGKLEDILTGSTPSGTSARVSWKSLLPKDGLAGSAVAFGLLSAALAALLAGGFAGRFGAGSDRSSLAAFGQDCGRFALPSLLLGVLSAGLLIAAWRTLYVGTGLLYDAGRFKYEWLAVTFQLLRLFAFLLVAGYLRVVVQFSRAAMGNSGSVNLAAAIGRGLGMAFAHPVGTLALEIFFGALGILPLALWVMYGWTWDGADLSDYATLLLLQQLVVVTRIAVRAAYLGTASAWLARGVALSAPASAPAGTESAA
ncbi:MAG: hypothetical protein ACHQPI_04125 [Thermoanaerobaculia bacterium]